MMRGFVVLLLVGLAVSGCFGRDGADRPGEDEPIEEEMFLYEAACDVNHPTGWDEPCLALASMNDSPSKTEIDLMVNPKDPLNVVVGAKDLDPKASNCVWSVVYVTKDGGKNWTTVYIGGEMADRAPTHPLYTFECITDPIMSFGLDGSAYYALQAYGNRATSPAPSTPAGPIAGEGLESTFILAVSRDGGLTWTDFLPMHGGDGTIVFHDYPRMITNPETGSIFATWNQINTLAADPTVAGQVVNQPVVVGTRDDGMTATTPTYIPIPPTTTERFGGLFMNGFAAANDGTIYMTLSGGIPPEGVAGGVWLSMSTDDAQTFSEPVPVHQIDEIDCEEMEGEFRCFSSFEIAIDNSGGPHDGRLYGVWADAHRRDAGDASDILSAYSDDGGLTWSDPIMVNDDGTMNDQFMTRATVGPDGTVHVVYMDRQYDPEDVLIDATYAYSMDGGVNWTTQRLTTTSFDGDLGIHQNGFPFIGDYIGIGAVGTHVYVGFPTTATGRAEVAVAHLEINEELAASMGHQH